MDDLRLLQRPQIAARSITIPRAAVALEGISRDFSNGFLCHQLFDLLLGPNLNVVTAVMRPAVNSSLHKSLEKSRHSYPCAWKLSAGILFSTLLLSSCLYFHLRFFSIRFRPDTNGKNSSENELQQPSAIDVGSTVNDSRGEDLATDPGIPSLHVAKNTTAAGPLIAVGDLPAVEDSLTTPEREFPFPPEAQGPGDPFLTICAIVRSETDLREWTYHYVRHFNLSRLYIYDHNSSPPVHQVLADYIRASRVTVISWPPKKKPPKMYKNRMHMYAYSDCLRRTKNKKIGHEWVAIFDGDEYLWLAPAWRARGIRLFLKQYTYAGALGVQWVYHGSDGRVKRPKDGVRKSYVSCLHDNMHHIKSMIHIPFGAQPITPHHFRLAKNKTTVTETHEVIPGPFAVTASTENISLHHYVIRSEEDFAKKVAKGGELGSLKDWKFFGIVVKTSLEICPELVEWDRVLKFARV